MHLADPLAPRTKTRLQKFNLQDPVAYKAASCHSVQHPLDRKLKEPDINPNDAFSLFSVIRNGPRHPIGSTLMFLVGGRWLAKGIYNDKPN